MSYSDRWYTPPEWLEWVAATLGEDYFDPCPANWDGEVNGLTADWPVGPTYVNHPGGRGQPQLWWDECLNRRFFSDPYTGEVVYSTDALIWAAFNIEQLRYLKNGPLEQEGWLVMPKKRIKWVPAVGKASSPTCWAVFWSSVEPAEPPEDCFIVKTPFENVKK